MSDSVDTRVDTTSSRERIKRALSHGKKGRINKDLSNKIMLGVFRAAAYITTLVLIAITVGGSLAGVAGMLFSVPVVLIFRSIARNWPIRYESI